MKIQEMALSFYIPSLNGPTERPSGPTACAFAITFIAMAAPSSVIPVPRALATGRYRRCVVCHDRVCRISCSAASRRITYTWYMFWKLPRLPPLRNKLLLELYDVTLDETNNSSTSHSLRPVTWVSLELIFRHCKIACIVSFAALAMLQCGHLHSNLVMISCSLGLASRFA